MGTSECYYYGGDEATDDEPCGFGTNYCCPSGDICVTDGLCQDKHNHLNGSLTFFSSDTDPGPYNYTGLYTSASCTNSGWDGCASFCTSYGMTSDAYIWACNSDLISSFCCHNDSKGLGNDDCCDGTTFRVESSVLALDTSLRTTATASLTTSSKLVITTTGSAIQVTNTASSTAVTPTPTSSSTQIASATPSVSGLSTGAKVGIGLGAAAVCLLALGIVFLWRRTSLLKKRLRDREPVGEVAHIQEQAGEKMEYDRSPQELPSSSHQRPTELPSPESIHELPGERNSHATGLWNK